MEVTGQPGGDAENHTSMGLALGQMAKGAVFTPAAQGDQLATGLDPALAMALARLMPLHFFLARDGRIRAAGPTLCKLFGGADLIGRSVFSLFAVRGPAQILDTETLWQTAGQALHLRPQPPGIDLRMRGLAFPLGPLEGGLLNLSFGIDVPRAVGQLRLSATDFAATDMALELLYLAEANRLVTEEMRALSARLDQARQRAEEEALSDPLTGLRNRRACDSTLLRLCHEGTGFALLHLDLDHFKQVNDSLGHAAGDQVLRAVAGILQGQFRAMDCIARVGGDEFIILLPGLTASDRLRVLAQRLIAKISIPMAYHGQPCAISASIGALIAEPGQIHDPESILRIADSALYTAKKHGRDQWFLAAVEGRD